MAVPQLVLDAIRFLLALAAPASLVALVLAGIALRREGTTSFSVGGGGFSKWMFWAIVMITLPQVFGWFAFWGVGAPLPGGGIGNGWMSGFANDAVIFVNTFVIGRLVPVLAAWMVLRSVIDWSEGYTPLASILGAMFLLAIPASAALLQGWNDGTRFGTAAVLEGAWTYTASRIMPIAAGLAVIGAVVNFAFGRPAIRLIRTSNALLPADRIYAVACGHCKIVKVQHKPDDQAVAAPHPALPHSHVHAAGQLAADRATKQDATGTQPARKEARHER